MFRDDDDLPLSDTHALERADHRRGERLERRKKKQDQERRAKLRLDMLRTAVTKQDETGTKTREEEVKETKSGDAQKARTPEELMQEQFEEAQAQKQTPYERQNTAE